MNSPSAQIDLTDCRAAQRVWSSLPVRERVKTIRRMRHAIAVRAKNLADCVARPRAQTLTSEILPLLEACRFLEHSAGRLLAPAVVRGDGLAIWTRGIEVEVLREPLGVILIVGPSNYPLFLAAVQTIQALAAGNGVLLKPGRQALPVLKMFAECLHAAGLPRPLLLLLGEDVEEVRRAVDAGIDKVILTGSNAAGEAVLSDAARHGIPAVMELSGNDVVFVRPGADLDLAVRAIRFGLTLNDGNTCIAPKQVLVRAADAGDLRSRLKAGGVDIPVTIADSDEEALRQANESGYALGATIFGPEADARKFAKRTRAGVVVINDMIAPTADPRVPFGGRGRSGFGVTRGEEGLLEMTAVKAVVVRRTRWLPHLNPRNTSNDRLFSAYIVLSHTATVRERLRGLAALFRALLGGTGTT